MLSDQESAMAMVEGQEGEAVSAVKDGWQRALDEALKILAWPEGLEVQYNPAIWRIIRHPVGMKLLSCPWAKVLVFEFATPNGVLPFDCFGEGRAKAGVMLHEVAHLIDDARWGFDIDLQGLVHESGEFITREQRAEVLAFACDPVGVFEANLAVVQSTARTVGVHMGDHSRAIAAMETMGHAGLAGQADPIEVLRNIQDSGVPVDRIIEGCLSTFFFSLAGLTTGPDRNEGRGLGIKRSEGLDMANEGLCKYLRDEIDLGELQGLLEAVDYFTFSEEHDPLDCVDTAYINCDLARENLSRARRYFEGEACFADLLDAVEKIEGKLKGPG